MKMVLTVRRDSSAFGPSGEPCGIWRVLGEAAMDLSNLRYAKGKDIKITSIPFLKSFIFNSSSDNSESTTQRQFE